MKTRDPQHHIESFTAKTMCAIHEGICALTYFDDFIVQSVSCGVHTGLSSVVTNQKQTM